MTRFPYVIYQAHNKEEKYASIGLETRYTNIACNLLSWLLIDPHCSFSISISFPVLSILTNDRKNLCSRINTYFTFSAVLLANFFFKCKWQGQYIFFQACSTSRNEISSLKVTQNIFSAYLKGLSKYRRMAFFFEKYLFSF